MQPCDFYDRCAAHDWTFEFSSDNDKWLAGREAERQLSKLAEASPTLRAIFEAWQAHVFSGPAYGTPRAPRPERPLPVSTFPGAQPAHIPGQQELFHV